MKLVMLGTGDSAMVPVWGCDCEICAVARLDKTLRREKSSAYLEHQGRKLLLDANASDLLDRFPSGTIDKILLTHYHMDHVHSLFDLRWGKGASIPVHSPDDTNGCDDLYKHPGVLDFSFRAYPFESFEWQGITVTPLPLIHSKLTLGYAFEFEGQSIAYLTDTNGLPSETTQWLKERSLDWIIIDCNYPPIECEQTRISNNHNDLCQVEKIAKDTQAQHIGIMHVGHELLLWAKHNPHRFSDQFQILNDGQEILL
ncbi:phosphonate metabolism protein PhnP [Vibrio maritimus]|uniref:phosphonate metabolism protein PhnP n=1 Tax=Vibrio maritimus TaxID=990268 RepID=UPI0040680267